ASRSLLSPTTPLARLKGISADLEVDFDLAAGKLCWQATQAPAQGRFACLDVSVIRERRRHDGHAVWARLRCQLVVVQRRGRVAPPDTQTHRLLEAQIPILRCGSNGTREVGTHIGHPRERPCEGRGIAGRFAAGQLVGVAIALARDLSPGYLDPI